MNRYTGAGSGFPFRGAGAPTKFLKVYSKKKTGNAAESSQSQNSQWY